MVAVQVWKSNRLFCKMEGHVLRSPEIESPRTDEEEGRGGKSNARALKATGSEARAHRRVARECGRSGDTGWPNSCGKLVLVR